MYGLAIRLRAAPGTKFHKGSTLYRLVPSLADSEVERTYVVVAVTPQASDHGKMETTVFRTDGRGNADHYGGSITVQRCWRGSRGS
jgi:hypothetical protein